MSAAQKNSGNDRRLSQQLLDLQNKVDTARYFNEAVFMAAAGVGDLKQVSALQTIIGETAQLLDEVSDDLKSIKAAVASEVA